MEDTQSTPLELTDWPRLRWDLEVSETSPVIHGTWVTVEHIVRRIVEGNSWNDILRHMPELQKEDIWEALRYTIAHEYSGN